MLKRWFFLLIFIVLILCVGPRAIFTNIISCHSCLHPSWLLNNVQILNLKVKTLVSNITHLSPQTPYSNQASLAAMVAGYGIWSQSHSPNPNQWLSDPPILSANKSNYITYLLRLLWTLNEIKSMKCLPQCLLKRKCSANIIHYCDYS
jgi:hypothetical protein